MMTTETVELTRDDGAVASVLVSRIAAQTCHECAAALSGGDMGGLELALSADDYARAVAWVERVGLLAPLGMADRWGEPCDMCGTEIDGDVHYWERR